MSLAILFIILVVTIALGVIVVFWFDLTLIKGAIKSVQKGTSMDRKEMTEAVKRFLENRSLNAAHKAYMRAVICVAGGNTLLSFAKGIITVKKGDARYGIELLYDNGLPAWAVISLVLLLTIAYTAYLNSRTKRYKADILATASAIINDNFNFTPNQEWFRLKTKKAIKDLGKAYDLEINFSYEYFDEALASTCRDSRVAKVFAPDVRTLASDYRRGKEILEKSIGTESIEKIEILIKEIQKLTSKTQFEGSELERTLKDADEIDNILMEAITTGKLSYGDYRYTQLHSAVGKIRERCENPWIASISNQTFIITGQGGCGKTHLLAKLSDERIKLGLPTIFFLGKLITDTSNPLSQIATILDVHSKKELFLKALDDYGLKHGRVLIVIDGINEGKGLSLWKNHLLSFINEFSEYKNIYLILSVRTNSSHNWFSKFIEQQHQFPSYRHTGFEQNAAGAVEYMFRAFDVPLPTWPLFQREFTNPMLLTLFCRTHSGEKLAPRFESKLDIIKNYLGHFNGRLAETFKYSSLTPLVQNALGLISEAIVKTKGRWFVERNVIEDILNRFPEIDKKQGLFLDALVDEGILNEYESDNGVSYSFGYDTIGAYMKGVAIAKDESYKDLTYGSESELEALTDLVPLYRGKELFELLSDDEAYADYLKDLFINTLSSRSTITDGGANLLNSLLEEGDYYNFFRVVVNNPFRNDLPITVEKLDTLLLPMRMVERDEMWTQLISGETELYNPLMALAKWGWSASPSIIGSIEKGCLRNIVHLLAWTLSTTYIELRDKSSRALINILKNEQELILDFISTFVKVDDPYIVERVYAVVFGCCTGNASGMYVEKIAQLIYDETFKAGNPPEDILTRDFAKCIVDYAVSIGCALKYDSEKVCPPYCKTKKNVYVETEEILKYKLPFDKDGDTQLITAQNNILDSMCTEYSSRGMYGDFGRYVFQSALDNWKDDIEEISNYGIKTIFEDFGYDAQLFKVFDGQHASWERHGNKIERIGKKYEWIVLYKIAAILEDNHFGEPLDRDWKSPTIYHLRRFDPTIMMNPDVRDFTTSIPAYKVPEYDISGGDNRKWMLDWKKIPSLKDYLIYKGNDNREWICLYAYYSISSLSEEDKYPTERELWAFAQSFFVDSIHREGMCSLIDRDGLGGRSGTENHEASYSYYREYYWADSYKTQIEGQDYINREYETGSSSTSFKVQPSYLLYDISSDADYSVGSSREMILPSPFLFDELNLRFSVADGVWLAPDGSVACYDSFWVYGGHAGLFVRKDLLLQYLHETGKSLVWPILMERTYKPEGTYWPSIQVGGYAWMDEKGKIRHKIRTYELTAFQKKRNSVMFAIRRSLYQVKKKLVEKGLVKVSVEEHLRMLAEEDYDFKDFLQ